MSEARDFARVAADRAIATSEVIREIVGLRVAVESLRADIKANNPTREELEEAERRQARKRHRVVALIAASVLLWSVLTIWAHDEHIRHCHRLPETQDSASRWCDVFFPWHSHPHVDTPMPVDV